MLFVQRTGFANIATLIGDIVAQLKLMGFTEVYGSVGSGIPTAPDPVTGRPQIPGNYEIDVTLEAPSNFVLGTQKWRIKFYGKGQTKTLTWPDLTKEILETYQSGTTPGGAPIWSQRPYVPPRYEESSVEYQTPPKILSVFVGSDIQLPNDGSWGFSTNYALSNLNTYVAEDAAGHVAARPWGNIATAANGYYPPTANFNTRGYFFFSRAEFGDDGNVIDEGQTNTNTQAFRGAPMSYCLSYTTRGLFFGMWDSNTPHTALRFSWCLIQRSVDRTTGAVRGTTTATNTSECPLFCVFGCETSNQSATPVYEYGIMVVREKNTSSPGPKRVFSPVPVTFVPGAGTVTTYADIEDTPIFINPCKQVSFNEEGNYMVTFISELVSSRYRYPDELDMVGTISSDVIGIGQELQFTVYGEAQPRTYIALPANSPFNTGMRLLVLKANPNEA
jgi:hypothetical protein